VSRILSRFQRQMEAMKDAERLTRILLEVGAGEDEPPKVTGQTPVGDWERLRGLPAVGRGVSGAMRGTDPLRALLAKESRNGRGRR
jgi:hypothetical protein